MSADASLPPAYFDAVYAADPDPWSFETSPYEAAKYAATLAALPAARFDRGFEIGCSIGVLTERLARRCDALLAVDVSEAALARARERCAELANVRFERMAVPATFPPGDFDLVVVSEVGYYWSRADLARAARAIVAALRPGGALVLVHWTAPVHDYPLTGDEVHDHFDAIARAEGSLIHGAGARATHYRLDVYRRG